MLDLMVCKPMACTFKLRLAQTMYTLHVRVEKLSFVEVRLPLRRFFFLGMSLQPLPFRYYTYRSVHSGIGPRSYLEKMGINVIFDSPGVGSDLVRRKLVYFRSKTVH